MRQSEWKKYYTTEIRVDPKTGKEKMVSRYIGPWYTLEPKQRRACKIYGGLGWALSTAAFVAAGLIPSWAGLCNYVTPWYVLCMVPLMYLLLGFIKLLRLKPEFTEGDRAESLGYIRVSSLGLAILAGVWSIAAVVFLVQNGDLITLPQELIFLGCGIAAVIIGLMVHFMAKRVAIIPVQANEKEAAGAAASTEENETITCQTDP